MTNPVPQLQTSYIVMGPRASDAVGTALRSAYNHETLPADMQILINQLNGNGGMRTKS